MLRRAMFGMVAVMALVCVSSGVASAHGPYAGGCGSNYGYSGYAYNVSRPRVYVARPQVYLSQPIVGSGRSCYSHQRVISPSYGYSGYGGYSNYVGGYGGMPYGGGYGSGLSYSQPGFGFYIAR
jgi:hypothetical protein